MTTQRVILDVDGQRLVGRALATSGQSLEVCTVEPVPGLRAGVHVPYFAMGQGSFVCAGGLSPRGVQAAERLLLAIHRDWQLLRPLLPRLVRVRAQGRAWAREEIARRGLRRGRELWAERRVLRRQLRHVGLDPGVYQRRLTALKREREARDSLERAGERWVRDWLAERGIEPALDVDAALRVPGLLAT